MKYKQCNDASAQAREYSSVFKETPINLECAKRKSYLKLISWVALYKGANSVQRIGEIEHRRVVG